MSMTLLPTAPADDVRTSPMTTGFIVRQARAATLAIARMPWDAMADRADAETECEHWCDLLAERGMTDDDILTLLGTR